MRHSAYSLAHTHPLCVLHDDAGCRLMAIANASGLSSRTDVRSRINIHVRWIQIVFAGMLIATRLF